MTYAEVIENAKNNLGKFCNSKIKLVTFDKVKSIINYSLFVIQSSLNLDNALNVHKNGGPKRW